MLGAALIIIMEGRSVKVIFLHVVVDAIRHFRIIVVLANIGFIIVLDRAVNKMSIIERVYALIALTPIAGCIYRTGWAVPGGLVVIFYLLCINRAVWDWDFKVIGFVDWSCRFWFRLLLDRLFGLSGRLKFHGLKWFENAEIFGLSQIWPIFGFHQILILIWVWW